jgi:hypothetical protein
MPPIGPAGASAITKWTAAAGKIVSERASGPIGVAPMPRPITPRPPATYTSPIAANHGRVLHQVAEPRRKPRRAAKCGRRPAYGEYRGRQDKAGGRGEGANAPAHFNFPRSLAMQPVAAVPQPITPRQVPLARPNFGGNQMRFRTPPNSRPQHSPRIVPDRPVIPSPIFTVAPSPRTSAAVMNHLHSAVPIGANRCGRRGNRDRRSALRCRAKRKSRYKDRPGDDGLTHAFLLGSRGKRPPDWRKGAETKATVGRISLKSKRLARSQ